MTRKSYRPSPIGDVVVQSNGAMRTLVFVRELPHPPQRGRIVADDAKRHGWEELFAAYSTKLGFV